MKLKRLIAIGLVLAQTLLSMNSNACGVLRQPTTKGQVAKHLKRAESSRNPAQADNLAPVSSAKPLSLEAKQANLLLGATDRSTVISIPSVILTSTYNPFSDGQTDAKMSLGQTWTLADFPAVGLQTTVGGVKTRTYRFHPSLGANGVANAQANVNPTVKTETDMGGGWFRVQLTGRTDFFYFNFDTSALALPDFINGVPLAQRIFSNNRVAPDPEKIGNNGAFRVLSTQPRGPGYNSMPFPSDNVHAHFPDKDGPVNAVGGVSTWGIDLDHNDNGSFKQLYTCFDPRNLASENTFAVPSGAGWHRIGNPAETLINNLEQVQLPVAIGRTHSFASSAFGMSEAITAFWLEPRQAFVTVQGQFHWYMNPYSADVCTEVWVHNCVPNLGNSWGMNCTRTF